MTKSPNNDSRWKEMWDARLAALVSELGETDGRVLHAPVPFHCGGFADVVRFPKHVSGCVSATCELLGESAQKKNQLGTFELMIAHRDDSDWGPRVISRLARYTCDAVIEPGHTLDLGGSVPKGSTIAAFFFADYRRFQFEGENAGLLLCIGITADEVALARSRKQQKLFDALKAANVYPFTDLVRPSVLS